MWINQHNENTLQMHLKKKKSKKLKRQAQVLETPGAYSNDLVMLKNYKYMTFINRPLPHT